MKRLFEGGKGPVGVRFGSSCWENYQEQNSQDPLS